MFVHIGGDMSVRASSVTAVINLEEVPPSKKDVTEFINSEDDAGRLQYVTEEIPKTIVITDEKTYVSSISATVLLNRLESAGITPEQAL